MVKNSEAQRKPLNPKSLARHFSRLGWTGFWLQLALLLVPIILLLYVLFIGSAESAQRKGINLGNYLSYGSLLVMLFTTFWFYRYTRLAKQIANPESCPPESSVLQTLWIGLGAGALGIFFSMILMTNAVLRLLFILLATPQTGVPFTALGGDPSQTLSAIDAVSLTTLLLILTAELIVLAFSLWLLFQATRPAAENADAGLS
jgi:hypothetical protein